MGADFARHKEKKKQKRSERTAKNGKAQQAARPHSVSSRTIKHVWFVGVASSVVSALLEYEHNVDEPSYKEAVRFRHEDNLR